MKITKNFFSVWVSAYQMGRIFSFFSFPSQAIFLFCFLTGKAESRMVLNFSDFFPFKGELSSCNLHFLACSGKVWQNFFSFETAYLGPSMDVRTDGQTHGQTDGQKISLFYRTSSPIGAAAQKGRKKEC